MQKPIPEELLLSFGQFVEKRIGLHLPQGRLVDIERGVRAAAAEMGWTDAEKFARHLMDAPACKELDDVLSAHLTIGETYFYRDPRAFEVLEKETLPQMIRQSLNAGKMKRLRIWSAACCTGEEPYSIAMAVQKVLGEHSEWKVSILATDLNPRFLHKAKVGIYGPWSFRTLPEEMRDRFFEKKGNDRWELDERTRRMVTFAGLNFVDDRFPSSMNDTQALDIIFCRNVLMYFSRETAGKIIGKLRNCLNEGGWLFTSATDAPRDLFQGLVPHDSEGTVIYRKTEESSADRKISVYAYPAVAQAPVQPVLAPLPALERPAAATAATPVPTVAPVAAFPCAKPAAAPAAVTVDHVEQGRTLADQGLLDEALEAMNLAIQADKLNAVAHYLRGVILHEKHQDTESATALNRALYLDPAFVLAHVTLGNLMRRSGKERSALRCFENARNVLARLDRDAVLPESGGMTAGRLLHMISAPQEVAA